MSDLTMTEFRCAMPSAVPPRERCKTQCAFCAPVSEVKRTPMCDTGLVRQEPQRAAESVVEAIPGAQGTKPASKFFSHTIGPLRRFGGG